jgi:WD40 repeat protein
MEAASQIDQMRTVKYTSTEIYSLKWSFDDTLLACAEGNGHVSIYDTSLNQKRDIDCKLLESMPLFSIRWRPDKGLTRHVLLIASSEGALLHCHATTGKIIHSIVLPNNQALCCDYSPEGDFFASGWKDSIVRVYDDNTKQQIVELKRYGDKLGHSNRVYSVKWTSPTTLFSAGWDNNVYMWDLRTNCVEKYFHGAYISGDAIDVYEDLLLTLDCSIDNQLKVWSVGQGQIIHAATLEKDGKPFKGYTAQFSKDNGNMIFLGGSGNYQGYLLNSGVYTNIFAFSNMIAPIYTCDFGNITSKVAFGTGDGTICEFRVNSSDST